MSANEPFGTDETRRLLGAIVDAVISIDTDGTVVEWNHAAEEMFGWPADEAVGRELTDLIVPESHSAAHACGFARSQAQAGAWPIERTRTVAQRRDGTTVPIELSVVRRAGTPPLFTAFVRDLSAQQALEERSQRVAVELRDLVEARSHELHDVQAQLRTLTDHAQLGIVVIEGLQLVYANPFIVLQSGLSPEAFMRRSPLDFVHPDHRAAEAARIQMAQEPGAADSRREVRCIVGDGEEIWCDILLCPMRWHQTPAALAVIVDVTAQHRAVRASNRLANELSLAEEKERKRLATALHDAIGQTLSLAKIKLADLRPHISTDEGRTALQDVTDVFSEIIQSIRSLTFELSPPMLYELGLPPALQWLCGQIERRSNLAVHFSCSTGDLPLEEVTRVLLFQSARELLVNAVKHARAENVMVHVSQDAGQVCVSVRDDGHGFDPRSLDAQDSQEFKWGLFSIRERMAHIGGDMTVESQPGSACRIALRAPIITRSQAMASGSADA